jgi:hypothetical protein
MYEVVVRASVLASGEDEAGEIVTHERGIGNEPPGGTGPRIHDAGIVEVRLIPPGDTGAYGWTMFLGSPILDMVAEAFPQPPNPGNFCDQDGTLNTVELGQAIQERTKECLALADQLHRLPELLHLEHGLLAQLAHIATITGTTRPPDGRPGPDVRPTPLHPFGPPSL